MNELSRAIADFAVAVAWQSGLVALAAILAAPALRRAPARLRHALLAAALVAAALVPFRWRDASAIHATTGMRDSVAHAAVSPTLAPRIALAERVAPSNALAYVIAISYLLGIAWALASLCIALRRTILLRRSAMACPQDTGAFTSDVPVRFSRDVAVPVTIGIRRPLILLPFDLPKDALLPVLAHEIAHVRRRDALLQLVLEILTLPIAAHPLVRLLKRRAAVAREMACDALVVPDFVEPRHYARTLLSFARRASAPRTALAFGDADALEMRLLSLREIGMPRRWTGVVAVAAILAAVTLIAPRFRVDLFGAPRLDDFSGQWVLDREATDFGAAGSYDSFTQTLRVRDRSVDSSQIRVRRGVTERWAWSVVVDGIRRPVVVDGLVDGMVGIQSRGSARWDDGALVVELSTPAGHQENARASLSRDRNTLFVQGEFRDRNVGGSYRFVFRRRSS